MFLPACIGFEPADFNDKGRSMALIDRLGLVFGDGSECLRNIGRSNRPNAAKYRCAWMRSRPALKSKAMECSFG